MSIRKSLVVLIGVTLTASALPLPTAFAQAEPTYVISETVYSAKASEKQLEISATYKVELLGAGLTAIKLLPPDAAITEFSTPRLPISTAKFLLRRAPTGCEAIVEEKGEYEIKVEFVVTIDRSGRTSRAAIPFPISSKNELRLDIPEPDIKIVTSPEIPIEIIGEDKSGARAIMFPPAIEKLSLEWYPKALEKELAPVLVAEDRSFITFSDGLVRRATHFDYTVTRGKVSSFSLKLPHGMDIRSIKGDLVEKWTVIQDSVEVKLKGEAKGTFAVTLDSEEPTPSTPAAVKIKPIVTVEASRQRGLLAMSAEEGLMLRDRGAVGARQADIGIERLGEPGRLPVRLAYTYDSLPVEIDVGVEESKPKMAVVSESHVKLERGVVTIQSNFDYEIKERGTYELALRLYKGLSILQVMGGEMSASPKMGRETKSDEGLPADVKLHQLDWEVEGDVLTVRLRQRARGRYCLQVLAQMNIVRINGVVIPRIETIGTESETGYIGISVGAGVNLQHHAATRTRQIDVSQLPAWLVSRGSKIGYTYEQPGGTLSVRTIKIEPEISAKEYEYVAIEENWIRHEVLFVLDVQRAGLFGFRFNIPEGMTVTEVRGQGIEDWTFKEDLREVWVDLADEVRGGYAFQVFGERQIEDLSADISLDGIEFMGTKRLEGWLGIGPRASIDLRTTEVEGLEKADIAQMPELYKAYPEMTMAYTYSSARWRLRLQAIILTPQIDVETLSLLRFQSGLMSAVEEIHMNVKKAEIKTFDIVLPEKAVNSTVDGEKIKTSELVNGTWHITLQNKTKGSLVVWVNYEQALGGASGRLLFTGVKVPGAYEQKGFIVVAQEKTDAEIRPEVVRAATPVDESVLPEDFVSRVTIPIVRSYRYSGPDREVSFEVTSHARADVAKARADSCIVKTVVKSQGRAFNYLTFKVFNLQKQFLKVNLGKGADLWGTYIRGVPVKSNLSEEGDILIPIMSKGGASQSFDVSIIWADPLPKLHLMETLDFTTPDPDVQVGKVRWDVFLPRDYQIRGTGGNMKMLPTAARDVGLVAIIWSYLAAVLVPLLKAVHAVFVPLVVTTLVVLAFLVLARRMAWKIAVYKVLIVGVIVLILVALFLPTLGRVRMSARRAARVASQRYGVGLSGAGESREKAARISAKIIGVDEIGIRQDVARGKKVQQPMARAATGPVPAEEAQQRKRLLMRKRKMSKTEIMEEEERQIQQLEANQLLNRALSRLKEDRLEEAKRDLEQAVSLDKDNVRAQQEFYRVKGMLEVAGEQFAEAQKLGKKLESRGVREGKPAPGQEKELDVGRKPEPEAAAVPRPAAKPAEPKPIDAAELAKKRRDDDLYGRAMGFYDAKKWREAGEALRRIVDEGIDLGETRDRKVRIALADARRHLAESSAVAGATVMAIQAQVSDQQREDGATTMLTRVIGGKSKGVMPIELTFPTAGTIPYTFEMPLAGDVQGRIRISCIRIGAALCLQGIIGLALLAAALTFGWRRARTGTIACGIVLVILVMAMSALGSPASRDYYLIAIWSVLLAAIVLGVRTLWIRLSRKVR